MNHEVILASASPRRLQLISMMGIKPRVVPSFCQESNSGSSPEAQVMANAKAKASSVGDSLDPSSLVIGADTLVVLDGLIIGKPANTNQAKEYLSLLSGATHQVYTGICIMHQGRILTAFEKSSVTFSELNLCEIDEYIKTGEPMDKAGAYGIQGYGAQFVSGISGCYFNVMGFPVNCFYRLCKELLA